MHTILRPSVVLLAAITLVLVGAGAFMARLDGASAAGGGPEMRLTANGCIADCTFANGESFTLAVDIVTAPAAGYVAVQSFIDYGDDLIYDIDGQPAADEIVWADLDTRVALRASAGAGLVIHGGLSGLAALVPVSTYTGNFVEIKMTCSADDTSTQVDLLPYGDQQTFTSGTAFAERDGSIYAIPIVIPKVSGLLIHCGAGGPLDTPTPTAPQTPTPMPALTPLLPPLRPSMRLTANGCVADCTFANSESFTLAVDIVTAPTGGYVAVQSFIDYGDDLIYDIGSQPAADEIVWADLDNRIALGGSDGSGLIKHGGLTGLIPPLPVSTYTGNFVEIKMACSANDTSTQVDLLPYGDQQALTFGAAFARRDGSIYSIPIVIPKVSGLLIHCGAGGPLDTPTPVAPQTSTPVPGLTPMPTPTPGGPADVIIGPLGPSAVPRSAGDVNCDNLFDAIDATLILELHAALLLELPCSRDSDVDGDGLTNSVDAALIMQYAAGFLPTLPP